MSTGRDTNGRFAPGNPGGPGRPPRAVETDYLTTLAECVSKADWEKITRRAVEDAIKGDPRARGWLAKYLLGDRLAIDLPSNRTVEHQIVVEYVDDFYGPISDSARERIAVAEKQYRETGEIQAPEFYPEAWGEQNKSNEETCAETRLS